MYQLRNLIQRRNVSTKPFSNFDAHGDFFNLVITAHVLSAAMEFLGMTCLDDDPCEEIIPTDIWMNDAAEMKVVLDSVCESIVSQNTSITVIFDKKHSSGNDKVHAYACEVLTLGLFYTEYCDAIREGDGLRLLRCWRYMLLLFKAAKRKNYAIEAFSFLAQYQFVLSPRPSQQLLWSRFINTHGVRGRNIPCDLFMEHLNRALKSLVALGANKTEKAIVRVGKCIGTVIDVLNNFDSDNDVQSDSGWRSPAPSKKDLETVLKEPRDDVQPFMRVPGCVHGSHNYKLCTTLTREHAGHVWGEREQVVPVGQITD